MLSIMIVDDERGVIELIKTLIDYDLVEVTIVGEVQNGVDAGFCYYRYPYAWAHRAGVD